MLYVDIDAIGSFFGSLTHPRASLLVATFGLSLLLILASWFASKAVVEAQAAAFRRLEEV